MIDSPYGYVMILTASALTGLLLFGLSLIGPTPERAPFGIIVGISLGALFGMIVALFYPSKWRGGWV